MTHAAGLDFPVHSLMEVTDRPEIVFVKDSPRPDAIRFMPALNVSRAEIDRMIEGLRIAIGAVR